MSKMKILTSILFHVLIFSVLVSAGGLPADWQEICHCRSGEGNLEFTAVWDGDSALQIGLRHETGGTEYLLSCEADRTRFCRVPPIGVQYQPVSALRETGWRPGRKIIPRLPVLVKIREKHWLFYLGNRLVAYTPAPFSAPLHVLMPGRQIGRIRGKNRFYHVPRVNYRTDFMIEEGAADELYPWRVRSGTWRLHTALAEALTRKETNLRETRRRPLTADKSPNFYSLKGAGREGIIVTGYDFYDGFRYAAALQAGKGEGGILFNLRDSKEGLCCYGWTLACAGDDSRPGRLNLWCMSKGIRRNLRSFRLPLFQHQWYRLEVRQVNDRISGYLDGIRIVEYRGALSSGGKIGLYADSEKELRFDDILLVPSEQQILDSPDDLEFECLKRTSGWKLTESSDGGAVLEGAARRGNASWLVGRLHQKNGVFSVKVHPRGKSWLAGAIGGYRGEKKPFFRLEYSHGSLGDELRLLSVQGDAQTVLQKTALPLESGEDFSLQIDASRKNEVRFSWNRRLVFILREQPEWTGAFGVFLGENSQADFSEFQLREKFPVFMEQRQKNPIFQKDSFMRHWASPEGQWIGDVAKRTWHKGDFLGDFTLQMPWIDASCLHLFVPDGENDGKIRISVRGRKAELRIQEPEDVLPVTLQAELPEKTDAGKLNYCVHNAGYLFWIEADGRILLSHRLRHPARRLGTRIRVEGMNIRQLARTQAYRCNVIDDFFYESPYAWQQNGGEWLIVNRFQCTPSWSHMIGENNTGLASLWRKQVFSGDMTLEFYAGTRHGHYGQAGNLNCTIFADSASPSRGYTATVTEWDQNQSQNWSRFYRNGKMLKQTDLYMVPRNRKGHYRRILNPLISGGRPIHGAWFYIKIRKRGNRLEYYFDDELIYTVHDNEQALQEGLVGIWTFVHSMTLAQIKISFDEVRPREICYQEIPAESGETAEAERWEFAGLIGGEEADPLRFSRWRLSENKVGSCRILSLPGRQAGIRLENQLGGGDMRLLPADSRNIPLKKLAGWEFNLRLLKDAKINFLYDICDSRKRPVLHCYQQLNAGNFTRGNIRWTGKTEILREAFSPEGQTVRIWIPHGLRNKFTADCYSVAFRGFGSEQLDFQESGIYGNSPGAAYEIRDFRPVFFEIPDFSFEKDCRFYGKNADGIRFLTEAMAADETADFLRTREKDGLNVQEILIRKDQRTENMTDEVHLLQQKIVWIHLPEKIAYSLLPHPEYPATLMLQGKEDYPDRRLAAVQLWQNHKQLHFYWETGRTPPDFRLRQHQALIALHQKEKKNDITVKYGEKIIGRHRFDENRPVLRAVPVLADVRGFTPFFNRSGDGEKYLPRTSLNVRNYIDADSGRHSLMISQQAVHQRLQLGFRKKFRISQYPVLQFFYRADDMANVSLAIGNQKIRLTREDSSGCRSVRWGTDWIMDGDWHMWRGIYADGMTGLYENPGLFYIRSVNSRSQTGRYSWLCLADMVFGPAVHENAQLYFTPIYSSEVPMNSVSWRLTSFADQRTPVGGKDWQTVKNGEEIRPDVSALKDGIYDLCFYGTDHAGGKSAVSVWPFLLDRRCLRVSAAVVSTDDGKYNGRLLRFTLKNHSGSPWDYSRSVLKFGKRPLVLSSWDNFYVHHRNHDALELNYPRLLRKALNQSQDGDVLKLVLTGIYDGAGNHTEDCPVEIKVDYAGDKEPPQWFDLNFIGDKSVAWNWIGRSTGRKFTGEHNTQVSVRHLRNGNHCLVSQAWYGRNSCRASVDWNPQKYDRLAFRAMFPVFRRGMSVVFRMTTNRKRILEISLQKPSAARNQLNRTEHYRWKAGEWQNFSIPVKQWLAELKLSEQEKQDFRIVSIGFYIRGTRHREEFRLDDFYIFDSNSKDRAFDWRAFDVSGIRGAEAIVEKTSSGKAIRRFLPPDQKFSLAEFCKEAPDAEWMKLEPLDKAGNRAAPIWIPLH